MLIGQFASPHIANSDRDTVAQQDPANRRRTETGQLLHHRSKKSKGGKYAAIAQRSNGVDHQQARMS